MALAHYETDRNVHPVDVIEQLAAVHDWCFDRSADDEINISLPGSWSDYHVSFNWRDDLEALHLACAFDIRVPAPRRDETLRLLALINEQLWLGHFDLWTQEGALMFRHGLLLSGGAEPNIEQCETLLQVAVEACERYYQSFQFVLWAGKSAGQALESSLFETAGQA